MGSLKLPGSTDIDNLIDQASKQQVKLAGSLKLPGTMDIGDVDVKQPKQKVKIAGSLKLPPGADQSLKHLLPNQKEKEKFVQSLKSKNGLETEHYLVPKASKRNKVRDHLRISFLTGFH